MPDLSHLWQRFVLATALIFGLLIGIAATVFGYSNTAPVTVGWSVYHFGEVPLWTVAIVPLAFALVAGTLYHWWNSLHHFTEHMRHRRRVHELEAEVRSLRTHLDQLLEMPDHSATKLPASPTVATVDAPALPEPISSNGGDKTPKRGPARKRISIQTTSEPEPAISSGPAMNGEEAAGTTTPQPSEEANS